MRELSKKSPYYLPKDRYLELKYFVRQYNDYVAQVEYWRVRCSGYRFHDLKNKLENSDPTYNAALRASYYEDKIQAINDAFRLIGLNPYNLISLSVRENLSYEALCARCDNVPWSRREFYNLTRRFFWTLDKVLLTKKEAVI